MDQSFRRIGAGHCGSVWSVDKGEEAKYAAKREDGSPNRSLHNDYIMHRKILENVTINHPRISIPACHRYMSPDDTWWDGRLSRFPKRYQVPCNSLITDRIPPFPKAVRDRLTDLYCLESLKPTIKKSEADQDCLIRPYLGRKRLGNLNQSTFQPFSLRKYPLHLDQIEELALDPFLMARIMADTLAEIYWRVHVDANDMEFVLAPPSGNDAAQSDIIKSPILGDHVMWILDFDCCKHMTQDEKGAKKAAEAFCTNDPFCPRPGRDSVIEQALWNEFKNRFIEASQTILDLESPQAHLPALWVKLVEQKSSVRKKPTQLFNEQN
ncbi:MAG: hypothetical protein L6R37_000406 [Teloschistes peruensis]|nr:MAG: hypothetical protein L6R37_000406 [Teloschistes peruensis]